MDEEKKLAAEVADRDLIEYFYLDTDAEGAFEAMEAHRLAMADEKDLVPFNAAVKGYAGARDERGDPWIVKPCAGDAEVLYHRLCTVAYLLDHAMGTLAAPTTVVSIGGERYRATKVVQKSIQISSYNYMEPPFLDILRADLVNRWLFFDEDRNPNNYLVIHNSKNRPSCVAIDYDKADLAAESMKITGDESKFGWFRTEKTRFLTLLRPENFQNVSIEVFDARLKAMTGIGEERLRKLSRKVLSGFGAEGEALANKVTANLLMRREYIDAYFRKWFKSKEETADGSHHDDYALFGQSFLDMYKNKN